MSSLPGRRFFDPMAAAVIELRRDLLWSRENAARSLQLMRAISHRPGRCVPFDPKRIGRFMDTRDLLQASLSDGGLDATTRDDLAQDACGIWRSCWKKANWPMPAPG